MTSSISFWRKVGLVAMILVAWAAVHGMAWAEAEGTATESSGGAAGTVQKYLASYALVVLCIAAGMLTVCKPARLRDRPKGEKYESVGIADMVIGRREVPVISLGMRIDQVIKMLGKPKVARRGEDIYRELAMAGKLSEEDAAKEHMIFEHSAGRYELVVLDKRVIQIKNQPRKQES